jgi:hypothetical protein
MSGLLDRLAFQIRDYLSRDGGSRKECIEIKIGLCRSLAEARDQFLNKMEFGRWCSRNGFGASVLEIHDRSAAISMGREPAVLRACLENTKRNSLRLIYSKEFDGYRQTPTPPKEHARSPERERAIKACSALAEKGINPTLEAIQRIANVSESPARIALFWYQEERRRQRDLFRSDEIPDTMQCRYEESLNAARQQIRKEIEAEVCTAYDILIQSWKLQVEEAAKILDSHKGVISRADFRKIRACLHPDHCNSIHAAEALNVFSELEAVLVKPDRPPYSGLPLPTTGRELLARRRNLQ